MTPREISSGKRSVFWAVTLLVPVLLLVITEGILSVLKYGGEIDLVVGRTMGAREMYSINRSVAKRYFAHSGVAIPEPSEDLFEKTKESGTLRVFCLGESTMAGFPYEFNATAPSFLRDRLQQAYPDRRVEVINVGLAAVGSYVVVDFVRELVRYEPDLFVIYVGHNEFYGVYGTGSTVGIRGNKLLTRVTLRLLHFRTFLALRDLTAWFAGLFRSQAPLPGTLMAEMIADQSIPLGSELYRTAREAYQENIRTIIEETREAGIPVLFSSLVSNVRDHPPFQAGFSGSTTPESQGRWQILMARSDSQRIAGDYQAALIAAQQAVALDSAHALGFYRLGQIQEKLGNIWEARIAYYRAKDLDLLRFRISEDFHADLKRICSESGIPLAPVDSMFIAHSRDGIPGNELLTEHLHPNIRGYFLIGKAFSETIAANNLLNLPPSDPASAFSDEKLILLSSVSEFDTLAGKIRIEYLTRQWPFVRTKMPYTFVATSKPEALAHAYVKGTIAWSQARYDLAEWYAARQEFEKARIECRAVSKVIPYSYEPLLRVADYYRKEGRNGEAQQAYRRSIEAEDNPYARVKLGIILLEDGQPRRASEELEHAFSLIRRGIGSFSVVAMANAHYLLAVAYANLGEFSRARKNAETSLDYNPSDTPTQELLKQINDLQASQKK